VRTVQLYSALRALLPIYGSHGLIDSASRRLYGGDWDGMGIHDLSNLLGDYLPTPEDEHSPLVAHLTADSVRSATGVRRGRRARPAAR
jgi:acetyl esterase